MDLEHKRVKRSALARAGIGILWFLVINVVFVFVVSEVVAVYANVVAEGQEAIELDRALSRKLGGTLGVIFLVVSAILCARWSVSGYLPFTSKAEK